MLNNYQRYTNSSVPLKPFVRKILFVVECTFCSTQSNVMQYSGFYAKFYEAIAKPNEAVEFISLENQSLSLQPHFNLSFFDIWFQFQTRSVACLSLNSTTVIMLSLIQCLSCRTHQHHLTVANGN